MALVIIVVGLVYIGLALLLTIGLCLSARKRDSLSLPGRRAQKQIPTRSRPKQGVST
jgi:hypothetical protein